MIKAAKSDKHLIVDILTKSFDDNKSVNYIIKQDKNSDARRDQQSRRDTPFIQWC